MSNELIVNFYQTDADYDNSELSYKITRSGKIIKSGKVELMQGDPITTLETIGELISDFSEEYEDWAPNSTDWHIIIEYFD